MAAYARRRSTRRRRRRHHATTAYHRRPTHASRSRAAKKGWATRRARLRSGTSRSTRRGKKRRVCRPKVRCGYRGCYSNFALRRGNGTLRPYKRRACRKAPKRRRSRR